MTQEDRGPSPRPKDAAAEGARAAACRAAIALHQARLQAYVALEDDGPAAPGPLGGLPYAAKDMFERAGRAPTWGLSEAPGPAPAGTAEALRRLDDAGAVRLGFTRMTALAYEPSGQNPLQGAPLNPHDPDFATGGSSSGSAVAVAAGMAAVALGSDTAGSLRIPAHCCGVAAWKPSNGAVAAEGAMPLAPSLDCIGLLAGRVADLQAAAPYLAPGLDWTPGPLPDRIAMAADALAGAHPAVRRATEEALQRFADLQIELRPVQVMELLEPLGQSCLTVLQAEAAAVHAALLESGRLDPTLARRLAKGGASAALAAADALAERPAADARLRACLPAGAQILALPAMPLRTPPLSETDSRLDSFRPRTLYEMSAYTRFANYLGWAAVAVPAGRDDRGLPVALQLVGPPGSDARLLALAARIDVMGRETP